MSTETKEKKPKKRETIHVIKDTFETVFGDNLLGEKKLKEFLGRIAITSSNEFARKGIILPSEYEYTITKDNEGSLILLVMEVKDE